MPASIVLGTQWGDEGKGKAVDLLADGMDLVVRYQGGNNAGHTVIAEGRLLKLQLIPSGILYRHITSVIADGVVVDPRHLKDTAGVTAEDITKRLMDFGFHAPTLSFPVPGTLMIEPTESESLAELDRFIDAMIAIRDEIREIEEGRMDRENNPLKHAPHTAEVVLAENWDRPYSREQAAYPADWMRGRKVWPHVSRIDNVYGDRNLFCVCIPIEEYA